MPLTTFDHVNVRTADVDRLVAFYEDVLGLTVGKRPDFDFPGAWMYLGDQAFIHIVGTTPAPVAAGNTTLEHFAFRAEGLAEFEAKLKARNVDYTIDKVPGFPVVQVNFFDPDCNHIHVDFDAAEHSA